MKLEAGAHVTPNVRLVRPLGEGGMGSVWVAEHLALGTEVAVKFLHGDYASDPAARARFSREAAASAQVKSSHVVRVYDHGLTDSQVPFIVMELLEGTDLAKRIEAEHRIGPDDVVSIVAQLAKALEQAHEKGIVHRDIKPENIFLAREGGEVFVKLLDFGIAKSETLANRTTSGRKSTLAGETLGTPFYMSPEQFKDSKKIDYRSDLYSVGVVVYEALTGLPPFIADTLSALAILVNDGEYKPASEVEPTLPKTFDAWFAKACARNPADRFGSARELSDALRASLGVATSLASQSGSHPSLPISARHVVVSGVEPHEMERASLRDTAFATSAGGAPSAPVAPARSRAWPLVALGGIVLLGGGALVWKLGAPTTPAVSSSSPSAQASSPPPASTTPLSAALPLAATSAPSTTSVPNAPSAAVSTAPAVTAKPSARPTASARPKGSGNERDIW